MMAEPQSIQCSLCDRLVKQTLVTAFFRVEKHLDPPVESPVYAYACLECALESGRDRGMDDARDGLLATLRDGLGSEDLGTVATSLDLLHDAGEEIGDPPEEWLDGKSDHRL